MVVVVAVLSQQLVDGEGIGLVTVVVPSGRGAHHNRPTLIDVGQIQTGIGTEVGVDIENLTLPVPDVLHGETAILRGRDGSVGNHRAVAWRLPEHIERVESGGVGLRVEIEVAGGTAHVGQDARFEQLEGLGQAIAYPQGFCGAVVVGKHGAHPVAEHRTVWSGLECHTTVVDIQFVGIGGVGLCSAPDGQDGQGIVDLGCTEGGGGIVQRLITLQIAVGR